MTYTLGTAARATGLSKSTIDRAIKDGRIPAVRTDTGSFAIDPDDLHRVYPPQDPPHSGNGCMKQDARPSEQEEVELQHARLQAEIATSLKVTALLCEHLHETRVDRDIGADRRNSWGQIFRPRERSPSRIRDAPRLPHARKANLVKAPA